VRRDGHAEADQSNAMRHLIITDVVQN